jgi:nucleolar protein 12
VYVHSTPPHTDLAPLTTTQAGPVQAPTRQQQRDAVKRTSRKSKPSSDDDEDDEQDEDDDDDDDDDNEAANAAELAAEAMLSGKDKSKKRKRAGQEELEETYMRKLAREEEKEEDERQKKRKTKAAEAAAAESDSDESSSSEEDDDDESSDESSDEEMADASSDAAAAAGKPEALNIPKHESLAQNTDTTDGELEKAARTVFLSNVSSECINSKAAEKALKKHLESFIPDLADNKPPHKIESIRFRSTAFSSALPKRAAYAKKETMESTTKSTNVYAVYTTKTAAREAVKRLNGSMLLDRHLHVDSVAHPAQTDNRRCVFVGNLPFVDDESQGGANPDSKRKAPADIEEGLWVQFSKVAKVESVRVVRDPQTRVGKGFAYVQFADGNGVEAALQLNEKKFPPMLPRILRVTRCRAEKKKDKARVAPPTKTRGAPGATDAGYTKKLSAEEKSQQGRAKAMLGKAAAAASKEGGFVFEGHRASEKQGKTGLKFAGAKKGGKKGPNGRKSRSAGWKGGAGAKGAKK